MLDVTLESDTIDLEVGRMALILDEFSNVNDTRVAFKTGRIVRAVAGSCTIMIMGLDDNGRRVFLQPSQRPKLVKCLLGT